MDQRPRVFIYLAILHFLEPLSKIAYFKITTRFPMVTIFENIFAIEGFKNVLEFWLLFPIAGFCLLYLRRWTYHIFLFIQGYSIHAILNYQEYTWPYIAKTPLASSMLLLIFNLGAIIYILFPKNRAPFFDRRFRWWETKPRFGAVIPLDIISGNGEFSSKILNISHSGVFIENLENLSVEENIKLIFHGNHQSFELNGVIRNRRLMNGICGLGIEFVYEGLKDNFQMRLFIREISTEFKNSYQQNAA